MLLLEDVIEEYLYHCLARGFTKKTLINKRQEYKQLKLYLKEKRGITELDCVTSFDLKAYIRSKRQSGLQPQSIVSMAKMVKAFFNWCVEEEYLVESPMKKVALPQVPKRVKDGLSIEDVQAMIDCFTFKTYLEARNKAILAMMADCGLRAIEIRQLTNKDLQDTSILINGKGNKQRMVSISPELKKVLIKFDRIKKSHFDTRLGADEPYFLNYKGNEMSHVGLYNAVQLAKERCNITKKVSPHDFRHFYSVESINQGLDIYSLSRLLGHADVSVTQRYLESMKDDALLNKSITASPLMNIKRDK
ncbi:tyrosine-type recombinase/integrase [Pontibacillus yanchengensis]|uniref:Tyrosine-type recombinase/integrase n=1 Tax=Pontibacillus yanchengensis TaxID=462910 RepID=A0A6I4ZSN5_9BACI|nr:tyrosine-type recombinase/integrase [Pontibacillus yanchengensis]MYL33245.1 tyrosine-type recombinase/integrase [Pontibacillus yanchengensis]